MLTIKLSEVKIMKNTYPGIKIPKKTMEPFNIFIWFSPFFAVVMFVAYVLIAMKFERYFSQDWVPILVGVLTLAVMFFLLAYFFMGIGSAVYVLTSSWGESYREYGPEYTQYTVDIKDVSGDKIMGSVKSEVTRDEKITLAGFGRFLLWITYIVWCIPAYLILRFIKFRLVFSTLRHRRAAGVCQYCGGDFCKYTKPTLRKACSDCGEIKDYIRIIPRKK